MADYYFKTENLVVGYDGKPLIRDINIGITRGEIVTLIGPNGSGKSTILKSITRQLKMVGGNVYVQSEDLTKIRLSDLAKKMAVVLTERMRPELMTCRDIVATGRYPYTGRLGLLSEEDEEKISAAMERVHALELSNRDFNAISDGQRQRVLLARAICQEPEIIILDEPTSFLDIRHKLELLSILRSMARERGITVIMSLHEIDLAQKISDKVICVKGEVIARYGAPAEVFDEDSVRELYSLDNGSYDPLFGSIELPGLTGEPKVMVISSGGTGVEMFRRLQKMGVPFVTGILYEIDVDCHLARHLAADIIAAEPFRPVPEETLARALAALERVDAVIDALCRSGVYGPENERLLNAARAAGKLYTAAEYIQEKESK